MPNSEAPNPSTLGRRFVSVLLLFGTLVSAAVAQAQTDGFAVERLYQSAPGAGWLVMDDLNFDGGWGVTAALTSDFAHRPLVVDGTNGTSLAVVGGQAFVDVGFAITYRRYRLYVNIPMPILVTGTSGRIGPDQVIAPSVNLGSHPDAVSDPRIGFDMRIWGRPGETLRVGVGGQLLVPSGEQADYVTDGTPRGMLRVLVAGDHGTLSYAGQLGWHIRPLSVTAISGGPFGNELLYGGGAGRRFSVGHVWSLVVGPEIFGETAGHDLFGAHSAVEGLVTTRFERPSDTRVLRLKVGVGGGLQAQFGAPQWRVVVGAELLGHQAGKNQ